MIKAVTESLSGGALGVLGITGVELAEALPTELPASAVLVDKVWRTADGKILHLEFQDRAESPLYRFLEYDVRLARHHQAAVRTIVVYHARVSQPPTRLDIGTASYQIEVVLCAKLDGDRALATVDDHLRRGRWEPEDRLRLALALIMKVKDVDHALTEVLRLVPGIPDAGERECVVGAIVALGAMGLTPGRRHRVRKGLSAMSTLARELYEDGREEGLQQGLEQGLQQGREQGLQEGREQGREEELIQVAMKLMKKGIPLDEVVEITGLSVERLKDLGAS